MKYKNISEKTLEVPGVGVIKPGAIVDISGDFNNKNFEKVKAEPVKTEAPAPKKEGDDISNIK